MQFLGSLTFLISGGADIPLLLTGLVLFGAGVGNASSLPPLIAQKEFAKDDGLRAVAWMVAISQATYAFAPAAFGLLRDVSVDPSASAPSVMPHLFIAAAVIQLIAV
ncbi:MAG: MFS transporter, partial [Pseudomonadota bacterium]